MDLSNDVVTEILFHLPVKSVLRFRTVCKLWRNIIDSSTFRKSHFQNQSQNKHNDDDDDETLFLQFSKEYLQFTQRPRWELSTLNPDNWKSHKGFPAFQKFLNDNPGSNLFVVGPVNGLICMHYTIPYVEAENTRSLSIAIYNPCLDEIKILPVSPILSSHGHESYFWDVVGFGFDNATKDYKVVQLIKPLFEGTYFEVYSGTTNTWRTFPIEHSLVGELILCNIKGIKSKSGSSAYWQIQRRHEFGYYVLYEILCFNMQNEVFETILYPKFEGREVSLDSSEVFTKDDDSFALFVYTCDFRRLEVWELGRRDNERCWTHITDINVVPFRHGPKLPWPQALWKRDGVVLMEYGSMACNLIFYDHSSKKVRKRFEMPNSNIRILEYKCSLISP